MKLFCSNSSNKQIARNLGLQKATGDYVYVIDGDDEIPLDAVENFMNTLIKEKVDAVFGSVLQIFPDGITKIKYSPIEGLYSKSNKQDFIKFLEFINSGEFVARIFVKRNKINAQYQEDILLWDNNLFILSVLKNIERFYCKDIVLSLIFINYFTLFYPF